MQTLLSYPGRLPLQLNSCLVFTATATRAGIPSERRGLRTAAGVFGAGSRHGADRAVSSAQQSRPPAGEPPGAAHAAVPCGPSPRSSSPSAFSNRLSLGPNLEPSRCGRPRARRLNLLPPAVRALVHLPSVQHLPPCPAGLRPLRGHHHLLLEARRKGHRRLHLQRLRCVPRPCRACWVLHAAGRASCAAALLTTRLASQGFPTCHQLPCRLQAPAQPAEDE